MKKRLLISILLLSSLISNGQIRWGVKAGGNLSRFSTSAISDGVSFPLFLGFHLGGIIEYSFSSFAIQPELEFIRNGGKINFPSGAKSTTSFNKIQLPINFKYKLRVGKQNLFVSTGPYLSYGVSAEEIVNGTFEDGPASGVFNPYEKNLKRLDVGLGFGGGMEFYNKYSLNLSYQLGLRNLNSYTKLNSIILSLGYFF